MHEWSWSLGQPLEWYKLLICKKNLFQSVLTCYPILAQRCTGLIMLPHLLTFFQLLLSLSRTQVYTSVWLQCQVLLYGEATCIDQCFYMAVVFSSILFRKQLFLVKSSLLISSIPDMSWVSNAYFWTTASLSFLK